MTATAFFAPQHVGGRFWVAWMLATIAAALIALLPARLIDFLMLHLLSGEPDTSLVDIVGRFALAAVGMLLLGAFIGLGQWWVLRKHLPRSGAWISATAIGYAVPLTLGVLPVQGVIAPWSAMLSMMFEFGLCVGFAQWLVLRRRVPHAGWWIVINLVGWALAFGLNGAAYLTGVYIEPMDLLFAFLVPIAVGGAGMAWLLREAKLQVVEAR